MKVAVVLPSYNNAYAVRRAVNALLVQRIRKQDTVEILIVDDGSTDGSSDALRQKFGKPVKLIRHPMNQGRSSARNTGAFGAEENTDLLLFVDSDCIAEHEDFIAAHIASVEAGSDISFGEVTAVGNGFWSRLQRQIAAGRRKRYAAGNTWVFTTANVAVRRDSFVRCGGFDSAFDRYGFEDRDLFARLAKQGARVMFTADAAVVHSGELSLREVAGKQYEAGFNGAELFRQRHPETYRRMQVSRLDCGLHPWLGSVATIIGPIATYLSAVSEPWLQSRWIPFALRAFVARAVYGFCFMRGTSHRVAASARRTGA